MRRLVVWLTVVAALVSVPEAASAKGPTDVVVSGPGIGVPEQQAASLLWDLTGLYRRARLLPPGLVEEELGPPFVLAWEVNGMASTNSYAYPFSRGGWVRHSTGGWFRGGLELRRHLETLGASDLVASAESVRLAAYLLARGVRAALHGRLRAWPPST